MANNGQVVYVSCMGALFCIKRTSFKTYLQDFLNGEDVDIDDYGAKLIAVSCFNVTDLTSDGAKDLLDRINS